MLAPALNFTIADSLEWGAGDALLAWWSADD